LSPLPVRHPQKTLEGAFSDAIPKNGPINWGASNHQIGKLKLDGQDARQRREQAMQLNLSSHKIAPLSLKKGGPEAQTRSFDINKKGEETLV
jgi:hypothetical protein